MIKIYSSQELLNQIGQYLAWTIPRTNRFKFVQITSLWSCMARSSFSRTAAPNGTLFSIHHL